METFPPTLSVLQVCVPDEMSINAKEAGECAGRGGRVGLHFSITVCSEFA